MQANNPYDLRAVGPTYVPGPAYFATPATMVRTYYTNKQFYDDAAQVALYGWMPSAVNESHETNGLLVAIMLVVGLVLTPLCIGVFILCALPLVWSSKTIHVVYTHNLELARENARMGLAAPATRHLSPEEIDKPFRRDIDVVANGAKRAWLAADGLGAHFVPDRSLRYVCYATGAIAGTIIGLALLYFLSNGVFL